MSRAIHIAITVEYEVLPAFQLSEENRGVEVTDAF
jgi:hypothetical protein